MIFISSQKDLILTQHLRDKVLGFDFHDVLPIVYPDGEMSFKGLPNVQGQDVFVLHTFEPPVSSSFAHLFFLLSALGDANTITLIAPYFAFGRSHSDRGRIILKELQRWGVGRLVVFDFHNPKLFENVPLQVLNLSALDRFLNCFQKQQEGQDFVIVSPDAGGRDRAQYVANKLNVPYLTLDKKRQSPSCVRMAQVTGDVRGKKCILIDDMVSTGETLLKAAELLQFNGAQSVEAFCTHGLLLEDAAERIEKSCLESLTVTDTLESAFKIGNFSKIKQLSVAEELIHYLKDEAETSKNSRLFA